MYDYRMDVNNTRQPAQQPNNLCGRYREKPWRIHDIAPTEAGASSALSNYFERRLHHLQKEFMEAINSNSAGF